MKLVKDWKKCYKWVSVWCLIITGVIAETWNSIPVDWQLILLNNSSVGILFRAIAIFAAVGLIGRFVKQGKDDDGIT